MVREAFLAQAEVCRPMGSPFTSDLCLLFAENLDHSTAVGSFCLEWVGDPSPSADSIPLRICGGLHALVLSGRDTKLAQYYPTDGGNCPPWSEIQRVLVEHEVFLLDWMQSPPQTNEVSRSAVIWPAFMEIVRLTGKPLHLLEVGASGGLNLQASRFAYDLGGIICGNKDSELRLTPEWKGDLPNVADVEIAGREACDLNPLDPTQDDDALRLQAYVWPDQADRHDRLNKAVKIARLFPAPVEKADAIVWLREKLSGLRPEYCTVIYSTIAWQYLPENARAEGERMIFEDAGSLVEDKTLAWVRFEADGDTPGAGVRLQLWQGNEGKNIDCLLGRADFHGRWIDWWAA